MGTKGCLALLLGLLVVVCGSCETDEAYSTAGEEGVPAVTSRSGGLYTRFNIHYCLRGNDAAASYANWTQCGGNFIPYNSQVRVRSRRNGFILTDVNSGMQIVFEYHAGRMRMSQNDYRDLIFSPTPVSYDDLNEIDREGIKAGRAMVGMTKQGVMVALGYPARNETPSIDMNTWTFWKTRYTKLRVEFDDNGKVVSIIQ